MEEQIKTQMYKAFWDLIETDLKSEPQNFRHLMILIKEIKYKLKGFVPNRSDIHKEFDENLDINFLEHLFNEKSMNPNHFFELVKFIINKIKHFCAPHMDNDVKKWEKDVMLTMSTEIEYAFFIPYFFKKAYEYIDQIENDIKNFYEKKSN